MIEEIRIPEISENVESGKVVEVLVQEGDMVDVEDVIIEFETEKAVVEIPSPVKGKIVALFAKLGEEMKVGDVIAKVDTVAAAAVEAVEAEEEPEAPEVAKKEETAAVSEETTPAETLEAAEEEEKPEEKVEKKAVQKPKPPETEKKKDDRIEIREPAPASPSIRRLARELGVDIYDVKAGGPSGRISEADVKAYVKKRAPSDKEAPAQAARTELAREPELPDFSRWGEIETVEMSAVRRITAENMTTSWRVVPHVTQFDRADITELQVFIKKNAEAVAQQGGKLTVTAILVKVCAEALKKFPRFNASMDLANQRLIFRKYVHIGVAVDTPRGLLVPVIRDSDHKSITDIAAEIVDLADRARNKKIKPDEMEGGGFTISNQGGIGGIGFTPIVYWPQVAILGVSRASIESKYIDGEFKPRTVLPLAMSYDHRIIDGADAARFLQWVCQSLENPFTMFLD